MVVYSVEYSDKVVIFFLYVNSLGTGRRRNLELAELGRLLRNDVPTPLLPTAKPEGLEPRNRVIPPPISPTSNFPRPILSESEHVERCRSRNLLFGDKGDSIHQTVARRANVSILLGVCPG